MGQIGKISRLRIQHRDRDETIEGWICSEHITGLVIVLVAAIVLIEKQR